MNTVTRRGFSLRKKMTSKVDQSRYGWFFILPFIIVFLIFNVYPILFSLEISFTDLKNWNTEYSYVGFANYVKVLNTSRFWQAMGNTAILFFMFFIPQILLSLLLAYWLSTPSLKIKGQSFFKVSMYLPSIITGVSIGLLYNLFFEYPRGPINQLLQQVGLISTPIEFFHETGAARVITSYVQSWVGYGPMMIMFIGAILGINPELFEAGYIDGCSNRQMFFQITLPLIRPILLYNMVCCVIGGLQLFDIPKLLTGGGPRNSTITMSMFIYNQAFSGARSFNNAAAASYLLMLLIAVISAGVFLLMRGRPDDVPVRRRRSA